MVFSTLTLFQLKYSDYLKKSIFSEAKSEFLPKAIQASIKNYNNKVSGC